MGAPQKISTDLSTTCQLDDLTAKPCEFRMLGLHLPLALKGLLRIGDRLLHPSVQRHARYARIARGLRHCHPAFLTQLHRLKLELSRKLASLHDPHPVSFIHLTRCL